MEDSPYQNCTMTTYSRKREDDHHRTREEEGDPLLDDETLHLLLHLVPKGEEGTIGSWCLIWETRTSRRGTDLERGSMIGIEQVADEIRGTEGQGGTRGEVMEGEEEGGREIQGIRDVLVRRRDRDLEIEIASQSKHTLIHGSTSYDCSVALYRGRMREVI